MIECIFTIDYEIYGNGDGSLRELVYEPAQRLMTVFDEWNARFVNFVEVAELEKIEDAGSDRAIADIRRQVREMYERGFEIGLHLHPQWCNARFRDGRWLLDYAEYNLCTLPRGRIAQIVEGAIAYLTDVVNAADYAPRSFRAGNWLLQPSHSAAAVLAENGIRVDSSVFKGGLQHRYGLDYRSALKNGYYWRFEANVNVDDPQGALLEIPTYTEMVPFWRMLTTKRVALQRKAGSGVRRNAAGNKPSRMALLRDRLRFFYPLKFDFCRMTSDELRGMLDRVIWEDQETPALLKPIVAIGHTKDLTDFETVVAFLSYLKEKRIKISTFNGIYGQCKLQLPASGSQADSKKAYAGQD